MNSGANEALINSNGTNEVPNSVTSCDSQEMDESSFVVPNSLPSKSHPFRPDDNMEESSSLSESDFSDPGVREFDRLSRAILPPRSERSNSPVRDRSPHAQHSNLPQILSDSPVGRPRG